MLNRFGESSGDPISGSCGESVLFTALMLNWLGESSGDPISDTGASAALSKVSFWEDIGVSVEITSVSFVLFSSGETRDRDEATVLLVVEAGCADNGGFDERLFVEKVDGVGIDGWPIGLGGCGTRHQKGK